MAHPARVVVAWVRKRAPCSVSHVNLEQSQTGILGLGPWTHILPAVLAVVILLLSETDESFGELVSSVTNLATPNGVERANKSRH